MAKRTLTLTIRIDGLKEALAAFRKMPKEANDALRDASEEIAAKLVPDLQSAARRDRSPQSRLIASTIKKQRDRVPVVTAGGTKRLGSRRTPAWKLLFGSEFGSNRHPQFHKRHTGTEGSWFFPTVDDQAPMIAKEWNEAADRIVEAFSKGGE